MSNYLCVRDWGLSGLYPGVYEQPGGVCGVEDGDLAAAPLVGVEEELGQGGLHLTTQTRRLTWRLTSLHHLLTEIPTPSHGINSTELYTRSRIKN